MVRGWRPINYTALSITYDNIWCRCYSAEPRQARIRMILHRKMNWYLLSTRVLLTTSWGPQEISKLYVRMPNNNLKVKDFWEGGGKESCENRRFWNWPRHFVMSFDYDDCPKFLTNSRKERTDDILNTSLDYDFRIWRLSVVCNKYH